MSSEGWSNNSRSRRSGWPGSPGQDRPMDKGWSYHNHCPEPAGRPALSQAEQCAIPPGPILHQEVQQNLNNFLSFDAGLTARAGSFGLWVINVISGQSGISLPLYPWALSMGIAWRVQQPAMCGAHFRVWCSRCAHLPSPVKIPVFKLPRPTAAHARTCAHACAHALTLFPNTLLLFLYP